MDIPGFWTALGLTLLAGLSTGIGSILAFGARRDSYRFLSVSTGFSAGVMLYVSFVEIQPKGGKAQAEAFGAGVGGWHQAGWFLGGLRVI
ncbi:MAG: zinc transporter ZupT, partial [Opitutia bacterium]